MAQHNEEAIAIASQIVVTMLGLGKIGDPKTMPDAVRMLSGTLNQYYEAAPTKFPALTDMIKAMCQNNVIPSLSEVPGMVASMAEALGITTASTTAAPVAREVAKAPKPAKKAEASFQPSLVPLPEPVAPSAPAAPAAPASVATQPAAPKKIGRPKKVTETQLSEQRLQAEQAEAERAAAAVAKPGVRKSKKVTFEEGMNPHLRPISETGQKPAVNPRDSVHQEYLVCLEDGKKMKMLKRHLDTAYSMTPEQYRTKWGLPENYPMVCPSYSEQKSHFAKTMGLGTTGMRGEVAEKLEAAGADAG